MIKYKIGADYISVNDSEYNMITEMDMDYGFHGITPEVAKEFMESLIAHITYVREAGRKLGVPDDQLCDHDLSKFSLSEFPYYARNFFGDKADPDGFALAWLHHLQTNEHHPEHWRFPGDFCPKGANVIRGCLPMPRRYLIEHIADLMGASKAYTGSFDLADWLSKNMARMHYHPETAKVLREELDFLGYADVIFTHKFGHEGADEQA